MSTNLRIASATFGLVWMSDSSVGAGSSCAIEGRGAYSASHVLISGGDKRGRELKTINPNPTTVFPRSGYVNPLDIQGQEARR